MTRIQAAGILSAFGFFATPVQATTWVVDQDGTGDFLTIQAAIDFAEAGDVIRVTPGEYVEEVDYIGKDVIVESTGGAAVTTIRPPGGIGNAAHFASNETSAAVLEGSRSGTATAGSTISHVAAEVLRVSGGDHPMTLGVDDPGVVSDHGPVPWRGARP